MAKNKTNWAVCSEAECGEPVHGQGLCHVHYGRAYRAKVKASGIGRLQHYEPIDVDKYWLWVKKELAL